MGGGDKHVGGVDVGSLSGVSGGQVNLVGGNQFIGYTPEQAAALAASLAAAEATEPAPGEAPYQGLHYFPADFISFCHHGNIFESRSIVE